MFDSARALDLYYDVVQSKTEWPTRDFSMETLAKFLGFEWRDASPSGAASIGWFDWWAKTGDLAIRHRILDYLMRTIAEGRDQCATAYGPSNHAKELSGMTPLQLRIQLQRLFNPREGRKLNVHDDFPLQLAGLAALEGQRTIRVVADPPDLSENYNCVAHALGLRLGARPSNGILLDVGIGT